MKASFSARCRKYAVWILVLVEEEMAGLMRGPLATK
jgi:hypothetical protein